MGKKEQLEELDRQLEEAKKKLGGAKIAMFSIIFWIFVGFLLPILWIGALLTLIFAVVNYSSSTKKINEINIEKAKLK